MDKKMSLVVIGLVAISLAVTCVTASEMTNTPLYTVRMEQASSKMNFLPTEKNIFTYTTENGHIVIYDAQCCSAGPLDIPTQPMCLITEETCDESCWGTCYPTCYESCGGTCQNPTCGNTCDTC